MNRAQKTVHKLRSKYKQYFVTAVKLCILIELAFTILFPLFIQLTSTFMSDKDLIDNTVEFFARRPTLDNYRTVIEYMKYSQALINSFCLSLLVAVLTTAVSSFAGYGFAKFNFKGKNLLFAIVVLSIIIPPQTIMLSLYTKFRFFDVFGIMQLLSGKTLRLMDSYIPSALLSATGFGFRGGLFIFLMRQFYRGIPRELMEAAYVDGANVYTTFFRIVFPQGRSLMITVFLLSFSWTWTDTFYANIFFSSTSIVAKIIAKVSSIPSLSIGAGTLSSGVLMNTATILVLVPLLLVFIFGQRFMIEGIENSGIVG